MNDLKLNRVVDGPVLEAMIAAHTELKTKCEARGWRCLEAPRILHVETLQGVVLTPVTAVFIWVGPGPTFLIRYQKLGPVHAETTAGVLAILEQIALDRAGGPKWVPCLTASGFPEARRTGR